MSPDFSAGYLTLTSKVYMSNKIISQNQEAKSAICIINQNHFIIVFWSIIAARATYIKEVSSKEYSTIINYSFIILQMHVTQTIEIMVSEKITCIYFTLELYS